MFKGTRIENSEFYLLEHISDAFVALDNNFCFIFVNPQAAHILERDRLTLIGKNIWETFPDLIGNPFYEACTQATAQQVPAQIELYSARLECWIENRLYPSPDGLTILFTDISDRVQAQEALRAAAVRLEALIANIQAGVIVEDSQAQIILANRTFCDMMGVDAPPGMLTGANVVPMARRTGRLFPDPDGFIERALELRRQQRPVQAEELRLVDGRVWERDYVPVFPDGQSSAHGGHLWMFRDVTERHRAERKIMEYSALLERQNALLGEANARLEALATTDGLTGLLNHRVFEERMGEEFRRSRRYAEPLSLIVLDVDHFKSYNDSFGHLAGNTVLRELARVLQQHARETDFVARFGGEEFALILPHTRAEDAAALAEQVRTALEETVWSAQYPITASFGVCELSLTMDSSEALVAGADAAMYRAKAAGRNRVSVTGP